MDIQKEAERKDLGKLVLGILAALMAVTSLSTDIYLPAMPIMQQDLQGDVELTVTGFLIGFSLAQIIWGPISDRYGRKLPMIIGLIIFVLGSIGCALSENITQIVFCRVFQAFGACVGPMLSRAMVRDSLDRTKAAEMLSTLMILMALAPIIGPLLGGQMIKFSSWHSIFWLLSIIGVILFVSLSKLPETLPESRRSGGSLLSAFKKYGLLLRNRSFMIYTLCVTFFYVGIYAFVSGSSLVYIKHFGVDPENYGWLFAINIVGVMSFSYINRFMVRRHSLNSILTVATSVSAFGGVLLFTCVALGVGGIYGVIIPVFLFFSMNGVIAACTTAAALDKVPEMAGAASALLGSLQYGSGIISSVLLAVFSDGNGDPFTMSWVMGAFAVLSLVMMLLINKDVSRA